VEISKAKVVRRDVKKMYDDLNKKATYRLKYYIMCTYVFLRMFCTGSGRFACFVIAGSAPQSPSITDVFRGLRGGARNDRVRVGCYLA